MKKLLLLFCFVLSFTCYSNAVEILTTTTTLGNTYNNALSNNEAIIKNAVNSIVLNNNEYIKIRGKIDNNSKPYDFKIVQSNLSALKEQNILQSLATVQSLNSSLPYDKFELFIFAKPEYSIDKTPSVYFNLTNDDIDLFIKNNKKQIESYYQKNFYNKIYAKWVILREKNSTKKPVSFISKVNKNGELLFFDIIKSSGNKTYDDEIAKIIKTSFPFSTFEAENIESLTLFFEFNKDAANIENKIKPNFSVIPNKSFNGIVRVILDKNGNILSSEIARTTEDKETDEKMLSAVQKAGNFFETIKYEENSSFVKYIVFNQSVIPQMNTVLNIGYFSYGDESAPSALRLIEFGNYVEYLVKKNWIPPTQADPYSITALFIMDKNGKVTTSSIIKSSNIPQADNSVLYTINSATLPPIPDDFNSDYIPVQMTFDYEMDPNINPILKELYFSKDKKK